MTKRSSILNVCHLSLLDLMNNKLIVHMFTVSPQLCKPWQFSLEIKQEKKQKCNVRAVLVINV